MGKYNIHAYLQCARKETGLTHPQACELPDGEEICTIESLSRIENEKRHPHPGTLRKLLKKYGKDKIFGNSYLRTVDYEILVLDKKLNLCMAEFRYEEAEKILEQIASRLSTNFLANRQYLAANDEMISVEIGKITQEESIGLLTDIVHMTLPSFGTKKFENAFVSWREAIIILQIGNTYGNLGDYEKALAVLEGTYANLMRYPEKFHYADGLYAVYARTIIKWKGEQGKIAEAFVMSEREIANAFEIGYMDTLGGLLYARAYNEEQMLLEDGRGERKCSEMKTEEKYHERLAEEKRSEINSGYEVAALISEMFGKESIRDFIRKKIR